VTTATAAHDLAPVLFRLLSLALAPPTDERLQEAGDLAAAAAVLEGAPDGLDALASLADSTPLEDVEAAYERLFGGAVAISPYEGSYELDPFRQARQIADVAGFYRAFGADAHGPAAERPDHAGCELEFLAFLAARRLGAEATGAGDDAERCREIEEMFLRDHAGRWLPPFLRAVAAADPGGVHGAAARLGVAWLEAELARRGVEPAPAAPRAGRLPVEADELACGGDSGKNDLPSRVS
jgi:TorA maturation chaperone TorD